jgi:hypothetical protein
MEAKQKSNFIPNPPKRIPHGVFHMRLLVLLVLLVPAATLAGCRKTIHEADTRRPPPQRIHTSAATLSI